MAHNSNVTNDVWLKNWQESTTPWGMKGVNPYIKKYKDDLTKGLKCAKVFFPMCGDVADMNWLAELGHNVVGVELSPVAVKRFFSENNIEYEITVCDIMKGDLYTSKNGNIKIYCGDFFLFDSSLESEFDGIWDRGSFNCVPNADLKKNYASILKSVMKDDCKVILELVIDDEVEKSENIQSLYGDSYIVKNLGLVDKYAPEYADVPIKGFQFFSVTRKN